MEAPPNQSQMMRGILWEAGALEADTLQRIGYQEAMPMLQALPDFVLTYGNSLLAIARHPSHTWLPIRRALTAAGMLCVAITGSNAQDSQLEIRTQSGTHLFTVEIALTRAQQERGLMFRNSLAADHGMLFYFKKAHPVSIWMKNTYIPLDIIFISEQDQIVRIKSDAVPRSLRLIPSKQPVRAVLEVPGGTSRKLNIGRGDKVTLPTGIQ